MNVRCRVKPQDTKHVLLEWSVDATTTAVELQIFRSESRFGPYDPITPKILIKSTSTYLDTLPSSHLTRRWYYKLRIFAGMSHEDFPKNDGFSTEPRDDKIANYMAKQHVLFLKIHGRIMTYFPVRTSGERCLECYDEDTAKKIKQSCRACWDTTFARGFLQPVQIPAMLYDVGENLSSVKAAGTEIRPQLVELPWFVDPKPGDVIVASGRERFQLREPIQPIYKRGVVVYWNAQCYRVPLSSVLYELPSGDAGRIEIESLRYN